MLVLFNFEKLKLNYIFFLSGKANINNKYKCKYDKYKYVNIINININTHL